MDLKKKANRKRDRFWKFVFPHLKKQPSTQTDPTQQEKLKILTQYVQHHLSIPLDSHIIFNLLENNQWDIKKSKLELNDYEEASHGILLEPNPNVELLGFENDSGTSCYIDALLFAMYVSTTAFDPLLTYEISPEEEVKVKLQTLLRLCVNKLRKGHVIKVEDVRWLRKVLEEAGWEGRDGTGRLTQGDTTELFLFLTETFDLPYLPFQIRLFHGATHDTDDDRLMTDRTLTLSLPEQPTRLQDILLDYFYNNVITGIQRQVETDDILETIASSPTLKKYDLPQTVTAWQVLELLPFYSANNELGESIETQTDASFPDSHMILPILLRRYRGQQKLKTQVEIPLTIDFNRFVNQNVDDPTCEICGHVVNWTLYFKSAVCHVGQSLSTGHYVSYGRDGLRFDDMAQPRVRLDRKGMERELAENAYLLFYELDKTCHHPGLTTKSSKLENIDLDFHDSVSLDPSMHHHHKYHLKDSCLLM